TSRRRRHPPSRPPARHGRPPARPASRPCPGGSAMPDGQVLDLIRGAAAASTGRSLPAPGSVNAMSVDVEDYYQVSAFTGVVQRRDWNQYEDRVGDSTRRVLDLFAAANVRGTFFILGCVAK